MCHSFMLYVNLLSCVTLLCCVSSFWTVRVLIFYVVCHSFMQCVYLLCCMSIFFAIHVILLCCVSIFYAVSVFYAVYAVYAVGQQRWSGALWGSSTVGWAWVCWCWQWVWHSSPLWTTSSRGRWKRYIIVSFIIIIILFYAIKNIMEYFGIVCL